MFTVAVKSNASNSLKMVLSFSIEHVLFWFNWIWSNGYAFIIETGQFSTILWTIKSQCSSYSDSYRTKSVDLGYNDVEKLQITAITTSWSSFLENITSRGNPCHSPNKYDYWFVLDNTHFPMVVWVARFGCSRITLQFMMSQTVFIVCCWESS